MAVPTMQRQSRCSPRWQEWITCEHITSLRRALIPRVHKQAKLAMGFLPIASTGASWMPSCKICQYMTRKLILCRLWVEPRA